MSKRKYDFTETVIDRHGVEREYSYDKYGTKFFVNLKEVQRIYKSRGIEDLKEMV
jgi:hypothetical protein